MASLVEGALIAEEPKYDEIINAALDDLVVAEKWLESVRPELRKSDQEELDADHARYIDDQPADRFWPAGDALKAAMAVRRQRQGIRWILSHPRLKELLSTWADIVPVTTEDAELWALRETLGANQVCRSS